MLQFGKMDTTIQSKPNLLLVVILGVVAVTTAGYFVWQNSQTKVSEETKVTPLTEEETKKADLGSELYNKAQNPIGDKLPGAVTSVPNPIEEVYKNPFQ